VQTAKKGIKLQYANSARIGAAQKALRTGVSAARKALRTGVDAAQRALRTWWTQPAPKQNLKPIRGGHEEL
jgi:hypothetical protein